MIYLQEKRKVGIETKFMSVVQCETLAKKNPECSGNKIELNGIFIQRHTMALKSKCRKITGQFAFILTALYYIIRNSALEWHHIVQYRYLHVCANKRKKNNISYVLKGL